MGWLGYRNSSSSVDFSVEERCCDVMYCRLSACLFDPWKRICPAFVEKRCRSFACIITRDGPTIDSDRMELLAGELRANLVQCISHFSDNVKKSRPCVNCVWLWVRLRLGVRLGVRE